MYSQDKPATQSLLPTPAVETTSYASAQEQTGKVASSLGEHTLARAQKVFQRSELVLSDICG